jgi:phosphatidylcholine synthase
MDKWICVQDGIICRPARYNRYMVESPSQTDLLQRKILAYSVHAFTATGAVWGFLSLLAVIDHDWKGVFVFQLIAMLVDGFDGHLARLADTKRYAPRVDGALMDNIIDYLTYVIVPALFFYVSGVLPPGWGLPAACAILLASAYQFSQTDAKTPDHFFTGFPSYWNCVMFYMLILGLSTWANLASLILLVVLVFIPIRYIYPSRTSKFFWLTNLLIWLMVLAGTYTFYAYPSVPQWVVWLSLGVPLYYLVLSLWMQRKEKPAV